jgi:porin
MSLCCTDVSKKIVFPLSALTLAIFSSTALADTWTCEQLDKLNTRSAQVVSPPSTCESLIGDIGGFRSALADRGWGVQLSWNPMVMYDLKGQSADPQQYAGQNFTWSQNMSLNVTYDLSRIGFSKDAQFTFSPVGDLELS